MDASSSNCRRLSRFLLSVFFLTAAFFLTADGHCQTAGTGSIQGAVADQTGAVLQNATVTITNTATRSQH